MKKNKPIIKDKKYYDLRVEVMLPATLHYRVLAEDAEQAVEMIKNLQPTTIKHRLNGRKEFKLTVYDSGSTIIRFVKNLMGIVK